MSRFPAVLSLIGGLALSAAAQAGPSVPEVVRMAPEEGYAGPAIWVSAQAAADPDHVVKWELFGETSDESSLHSVIRDRTKSLPTKEGKDASVGEVPESQCPDFTVSSAFSHLSASDRPDATLNDLVDNSIGVYAGTITGQTPGFSFEVPSTILSVAITQTLRTPGSSVPPSTLYLLSPVAHFRIGPYIFCGEQSSSTGEPEVGDQVIVFVYQWVKSGTALVAPQANQLIVASRNGLRVAPALRGDTRLQVNSFNAILGAVTQAIRLKDASKGGRP
jgi:hypothetical protein